MTTKIDHLTTVCQNNGAAVRALAHIVARYGLAIVIGWIGIFKFCSYEALNIQPLVANSPFMGWLYSVFSVTTFSSILGVVEIATAVLLVVKPWYPRVSLLGSALAIVLFVSTLSFLLTTPGVGEASAGGFPFLSMTGQFLLKDIVLLGVSIFTLADAMEAVAHRAAPPAA
ncbi:YkgB family protein [Mycobacterium sp. HM-7]